MIEYSDSSTFGAGVGSSLEVSLIEFVVFYGQANSANLTKAWEQESLYEFTDLHVVTGLTLKQAGFVKDVRYMTPKDPLLKGLTATGDAFHSDGRVAVIELK